jgi:hypothetical protein
MKRRYEWMSNWRPVNKLRVPTQWIQRFSSLSSANTWPASDQFQQLAMPPQLHLCTRTSRNVPTPSSSWHNALGLGAPIQRPLPGPVTERYDAATTRTREACHRVNWQGQASLHPQRNQLREQPEPTSYSNPCHSTACHATTAPYKNYALWSPHTFPLSLQHLSNHLCGCVCGGGGDVGTSHSNGFRCYEVNTRSHSNE